jgi:hypothetical protein
MSKHIGVCRSFFSASTVFTETDNPALYGAAISAFAYEGTARIALK